MENQKKNNIIAGVLIGVVVLLGVVYVFYKKAHAPVVPQAGDTATNTTVTPVPVKDAKKPNLTITSNKTPAKSDIVVVTAKDQVIKDIVDGNYDKAKTEILAELAKHPKDAELWYIDSSLQAQVSDFVGAIASVKNALSYDPQNTTYWKWDVSLAEKQMAMQKIEVTSSVYRDAIKAIYADALKATNSNIEIITPYAIYLANIGDKAQAITYWQKAIVANPLSKSSYETEIALLQK